MAATRKPIDAFDYAKEYLKNMPLETVQAQILDDIASEIWMAASWRWTIGVFDNTALVANTTDYNISNMPTDFLYIAKAYLTDGTRQIHLEPEPTLASTGVLPGQPSKIAFISGTPNKFRIFPKMQTIQTGTTWTLVVFYKKSMTRVTKKNAHTAGTLVMDDEWFHVYREGVLYRAYKYGDDDRAGGVQVSSNGQRQFSGQLGYYQALLLNMKESEPLLNVPGSRDEQRSQG